jgi:hydrogenase/urease accessory protein HupE
LNRRVVAFLVAAALLCSGRPACAHAIGLSRGEYRISGSLVRVLYVFSGTELATALPAIDADHDGRLSPAEMGPGGDVIDRRIVGATRVRADGSGCRPHLDSIAAAEGDAVQIRASFSCDHAPHALSIDCTFMDAFSSGHRHLATVTAGGHETSFILVSAQEHLALDLDTTRKSGATFWAMVWTGITHIWTGYDHLAFLLGILLVGGRVRTLVGVVSAFTVAHSMTLALAVLGVVSPPPSIVEPAIALSIAYVGVENVINPEPSRRWRLTFLFGLVHGFGFAGALRELDLPRAQIPAALFAFNLGVEIGQLAVVAAILPLILWARRRAAFRTWGVRALSVALSLAGCTWFVMRVAR